jgi:uncharacterized protein YkwD
MARQHQNRFNNICRSVLVASLLALGACSQSVEPIIYASLASNTAQLNAEEARGIINDYRQSRGLAPLSLDPLLMAEANAHSRDMAFQDKVGQDVSTRGDFDERLENAGIRRSTTAENVGAGYHTIAQAFSGWRGSPNHDKTLLLEDGRFMGIAASYNALSKYKVFWTLIVTSD